MANTDPVSPVIVEVPAVPKDMSTAPVAVKRLMIVCWVMPSHLTLATVGAPVAETANYTVLSNPVKRTVSWPAVPKLASGEPSGW